MVTIAQRRLEPNNSLYHHGLVRILILIELREKIWDWDMFMTERVINIKPIAKVLLPSVR
jgi:hypothetical protein